jgi:hypothetical protein
LALEGLQVAPEKLRLASGVLQVVSRGQGALKGVVEWPQDGGVASRVSWSGLKSVME